MSMLVLGGLLHENALVKSFYSFLLTQCYDPTKSIILGKFWSFNNA